MSLELVRLGANDYEEALDLMNLVFSQNGRPHDFEKLLPKMCVPDEAHMRKHFGVRRDGRLRSILGVYPLPTRIGERDFMFSTVGNVATHLKERNSGMMRTMMQEAMRELDRIGADASRLGGLRSRYNHYGYEQAGTQYHMTLTARNIRDTYGHEPPVMEFVPMQRDDTELLTRAKALYDRGRFRVLRGTLEDFYLTCIAWQSIPYAAMQNGSFVGYLVVGADGTGAAEVCGETPELSADLLAAWLSWRGVDNVSVTLMPTDTELLRILSARCEKTWIGMPSNFYLRSWAPLIEALLREKARMVPLLSGRMTVCIGDYGSVEMTVDGANITAIQSAAKPDFTLDALTATRFFGGPLAPNLVTPVPDQAAMLAASWFPLPLSWNGQDRV